MLQRAKGWHSPAAPKATAHGGANTVLGHGPLPRFP